MPSDASNLRHTTPSQFLSWWFENLGTLISDQALRTHFAQYYGSYLRRFPSRLRYFYDRQLREVLGLYGQGHAKTVLEVGCGMGTESLYLAMNGAVVRGLEINTDRLKVALARKQILERVTGIEMACEFSKSSLLELPDSDKFDVVWMEQAFHHLEPRHAVIQKLANIVPAGGYVVISEANALNPLLQLQLFSRRGTKTIAEYVDEDGKAHVYGNERVLASGTLAKLLRAANFEVVGLEHFRVLPNLAVFDRFLALEVRTPQQFLPLFTHFNIVARKGAS